MPLNERWDVQAIAEIEATIRKPNPNDEGQVEPSAGEKEIRVEVGGDGSKIKDAIIDKNARIGENVLLSPQGVKEGWADERQNIYARDGVLVIVKNALVESGTKIGEI